MSEKLREMLSYCRPSGSATEAQFVKKFIDVHDPLVDAFGNRILIIGPQDAEIMFASHFDTVHRRGGRQKVRVSRNGEYIATSRHSNCLGADDTTGVYIMLELIEAKIPGVYVFHYGEEVGCIGAQGLHKDDEFNILPSLKASIEFDRRGYDSCVTHQMGQRCASDEFAKALCKQLPGNFVPDDGGIWTDNQEYVDTIPEVVNLSVGYFSQHSSAETQNPSFVAELVHALKEVDYESLPILRDPTIVERTQSGSLSGGRGRRSGGYSQGSFTSLLAIIEMYPEAAADAMWEYGFSERDIEAFVPEGMQQELDLDSSGYEAMTDGEISQALADEISDDEHWMHEHYERFAG